MELAELRKASAAYKQQDIEEMLKDRLKKLGSITTNEVWQICRHKYNYGVIAFYFKLIMNKMVIENKADFIRNGLYWIYKK